jgi:hypothetical protein
MVWRENSRPPAGPYTPVRTKSSHPADCNGAYGISLARFNNVREFAPHDTGDMSRPKRPPSILLGQHKALPEPAVA